MGVGKSAAEGLGGADGGEEVDWVEVVEDFDEEFGREFEEGGVMEGGVVAKWPRVCCC